EAGGLSRRTRHAAGPHPRTLPVVGRPTDLTGRPHPRTLPVVGRPTDLTGLRLQSEDAVDLARQILATIGLGDDFSGVGELHLVAQRRLGEAGGEQRLDPRAQAPGSLYQFGAGHPAGHYD